MNLFTRLYRDARSTKLTIQFSAYFPLLFFVFCCMFIFLFLSHKTVFSYSPSAFSSLSFSSLPPSSLQNNLSASSYYKACRPNSFFQIFIGLSSYILAVNFHLCRKLGFRRSGLLFTNIIVFNISTGM